MVWYGSQGVAYGMAWREVVRWNAVRHCVATTHERSRMDSRTGREAARGEGITYNTGATRREML